MIAAAEQPVSNTSSPLSRSRIIDLSGFILVELSLQNDLWRIVNVEISTIGQVCIIGHLCVCQWILRNT